MVQILGLLLDYMLVRVGFNLSIVIALRIRHSAAMLEKATVGRTIRDTEQRASKHELPASYEQAANGRVCLSTPYPYDACTVVGEADSRPKRSSR